ncbi:hypothetical protein HYDPIDRAFT_77500 [Hydnomerulius pinastri MD-312]|nr:hypothetical protein HYDPIDRAFT_77500 [Hydnomerulius pinastri MD-312]
MFLPKPGGRFPVGATTFKLAVPPSSLSRAKVPVSYATPTELKPALVLQEVVFTAYYPADVQSSTAPRGLSWLLRSIPLAIVANRIPVYPNAPLLNSHATGGSDAFKSSPWPLVVFSHGLGGSRTAYSQVCTRMASTGHVVLALEHRDGSGHVVVPSSSAPTLYIKEADLVWPPEHPPAECNILSFRGDQLAFRRREIYHAFAAIRTLVDNGHQESAGGLHTIDGSSIDWSSWTSIGSEKPIQCEENVVLAGHSFGGATVLSILSNDPPENEPFIPTQKALILDPWLEPLPSPGPLPHHTFREHALPRILVINSENFTLWKDHFERLTEVAGSWEKNQWQLLTIARAQHTSFSDFPVLPLASRKGARLILNKIMNLSLKFLDSDGAETVAELSAKKMEVRVIGQRPDGRPKRQIVGDLGDVIRSLICTDSARMASKTDTSDTFIPVFQSIGLSQSKAAEAAKNAKSATVLRGLIESHDLASKSDPLGEKRAVLVAALAVQLSKSQNVSDDGAGYIVKAIREERLKSTDQVNVAAKYFEGRTAPVDEAEFNETCGVGVVITTEQLDDSVKKYIQSNTASGWANLGAAISGVKNEPALRWANPLEVKQAVERVFTQTFGAKEAAKPKAKEPKKAANAPTEPTDNTASVSDAAQRAKSRKVVFEEGFLGALHKPGENPQIRSELREKHLAATGGLVYTRFPPEPNGYLHIGHCKAIFVDFGYAAHHGGRCYLRFDDTNPEKEEARYFTSIIEVVRWLGFEPWKITYSSDYFDQLYELAIELIKRDKAYVCHCSQEQIKADRGEKVAAPRACVHRDRPVEESLEEFKKMKDGLYRPKEAFLRMKQDLTDPNPKMWDLTAYRVMDSAHHRTHDKWKIYPTYEYTHCLVDSFENISHSLCTTEFVTSRQSYEWLCDALEVYKPKQSEFGRLNVTGTINSKRRILQLVNEGYVAGWDDPRLYTVIALRRRGVPPEAILSFVSTLGVSTAESNIQIARFEQTVRQYLEGTAPRLLMVLRPLKVTIENLPEDYVLMVEKPLHPKVPELGTSTIPFTRTLYIDADDFRLEDSKDYFRLAPGKTVGLFQAPHPITCTSYKTDQSTGEVTELICHLEDKSTAKPKAYIQWVAEHAPSGSPVRVDETRIFYPLFKSDNPMAAVPDFKADINPHNMDIVKGAMVEVGFWPLARESIKNALAESRARAEKSKADGSKQPLDPDTPVVTPEQLVGKECVRFQGLRVAYFALDSDSRVAMLDKPDSPCSGSQGDYLVLNRIVSLKEDAGKGA